MNIIIKYIISGGTAALVDLVVLHVLDSFHFHYLVSVNIAFIIAFVVSFSFQKYWTFHDAEKKEIHQQLVVYFIVSVCNIFVNIFLVHFFLYLQILPEIPFLRPIVIAQIISSALIAIESFLIYRYCIFKKDISEKKEKPNILIITQKLDMNDSYFGFFHDWVSRFSLNCDNVTVIALEVGPYELASNVKVLSLRKGSKIKSLILLWRHSFLERKNYDVVFCHMSPLYVIAGWSLWIIFGKKISLWYVHRSVDLKLRIAYFLSDIVFTATPESFRLQGKKVKYMGQAVDMQKFLRPNNFKKSDTEHFKIITVGRVTPIKNLDTLIDVIYMIKARDIPIRLSVIGDPLLQSDFEYKKRLEGLIKNKQLDKEIIFVGSIPNKDLPKYYWDSDICVNLAPTGGLDKAVLEAMAASLPVVVANKAFEGYLDNFVGDLLCVENNPADCAQKIVSIYNNKNSEYIGKALYDTVSEKSNLNTLISSIVNNFNG